MAELQLGTCLITWHANLQAHRRCMVAGAYLTTVHTIVAPKILDQSQRRSTDQLIFTDSPTMQYLDEYTLL